jgi:HlyD family secretion protein
MNDTTAVPVAPVAPRRPLSKLIDVERQRQRRRRVLWAVAAAVLVLGGAGLGVALRPRPVPMAERFKAVQVTTGDVLRVVRATGHVEAVTSVSVGAEISGRISTVEVDFNGQVKEGQVLARFDKAALEAQRVQVEAQLAAARATLTQVKVDLAQAQRTLARSDQLFTRAAQTEAEHEAARSAASLAEARVAAAQAQVAAQLAASVVAKTNVDHAVVRSPIDGVVIARNVDPGQTVAAMLQTPVLFVVAADLERMRVVAAIDEADIGEVKAGQRATFTVTAWPDRTFEGVVAEVRNAPAVVQDVVTYGAVVAVQNPGRLLKPGMTASVKVQTAQALGVTRVPSAALHFAPPGAERSAGPSVWELDAAGPRQVAVQAGITDGEHTQVDGLSVGRAVLTELTPQGKKAYGLDRKK